MWLLVSSTQPDFKFTILGDHRYVVGRQNCDIVLPDASVSRKQAILTMAHYESNIVKSFITPTLTLEDVSKFGTFVNGKAVRNPGGNTLTLKHNDEIKLGGSPASVFKAVYEPFIATTSCLEKLPKKSLHKIMCLLGGHLVRDWRPTCDLLIMSKINVTIKVICAINNQKHIVLPQYLEDLHSHLMGNRAKPDPVKYLPEIVDQEVPEGVSFHPDIRRLTLLQGMKFYFLSAVQFNKTNLAVSTAGGQPILLEDGTEEEAEIMAKHGTVVVSVSRDILTTLSPSCQKFVRVVYSVLKSRNLRMVTDPEIGWAILTCNTQDFCNPHSAITPGMLSSMASQSLSQGRSVGLTQLNSQLVGTKSLNRSVTNMHDNQSVSDKDIKPTVQAVKTEVPSLDMNPSHHEAEVGLDLKTGLITGQQNIVIETEMALNANKTSEQNMSASSAIADTDTCPQSHFISHKSRNESSKRIQDSGQRLVESLFRTPDLESMKGTKGNNDEKLRKASNVFGSSSRTHDKELLEDYKPITSSLSENRSSFMSHKGQKKAHEDEEAKRTVSVFALQRAKKNVAQKITSLEDSDEETLESTTKKALKRKSMFAFDDDEGEEASLAAKHSKSHQGGDIEGFGEVNNEDYDRLEGIDRRKEAELDGADEGLRGNGRQQHTSGTTEDILDVSSANGAAVSAQTRGLRATPAVSENGWLTTREKKLAGEGDEDIKPELDLVRDSEGKLLRNLCPIQFADLIAQPTTSKEKSIPAHHKGTGQKNVKKFVKTQNAGTGKLPTIIGGRDLEVYLGNKHKEIEHLFTVELAEQNKRQEEERRGNDLFDWDDRPRKVNGKRKR